MLNTKLLQQDYDYNENLIKRLEPYKDRKVGQLPENIKKMVEQIQIGPQISGSGLESISKILTELYLANIYLEETLKDPEGSEKRYTEEIKRRETKPTEKTEPVQPKTSQESKASPKPNLVSKTESVKKPVSQTNSEETPLEIKFKPSAKIIAKPAASSQPANDSPPPSSQIEL